ncbi:hypothetical protein AGIG_G4190 [Arapaima gigas]
MRHSPEVTFRFTPVLGTKASVTPLGFRGSTTSKPILLLIKKTRDTVSSNSIEQPALLHTRFLRCQVWGLCFQNCSTSHKRIKTETCHL